MAKPCRVERSRPSGDAIPHELHSAHPHHRPGHEVHGVVERHDAQQLVGGVERHAHQARHAGHSDALMQSACTIIYKVTDDERVQIPIRPERMQQQFVDEHAHGKPFDMLPDGQQRRHVSVSRLHHGIRHEQPFYLSCQLAYAFIHVGKVARDDKEHGHMERIDHLFGVRIFVADINQVEDYHQHDKHTLEII